MKYPIKINQSGWNSIFQKCFPATTDPRILLQENVDRESFSKAVSLLKFGKIYKTTRSSRHPQTSDYLAKILEKSTIVDLGSSDGTTSLDLIKKLNYNFSKYYVTDLNIEIGYSVENNTHYFFDYLENCILIANNRWVIYPGDQDSSIPFRYLAQLIYKRVKKTPKCYQLLINPQLAKIAKENNNIYIKRYNIFEPWEADKADVVIAANILNKCYFTDVQLEKALLNIYHIIKNPGRLVVIHDLNGEHSNIFRIEDKNIIIEKKIGNGVAIANLVFESFKKSTKNIHS